MVRRSSMPLRRVTIVSWGALSAAAAIATITASCSYPTRVFSSPDADTEADANGDGMASATDGTIADGGARDASNDALEATDGPHTRCVGGSSGEVPFTSTMFGCRDVFRPDAAVGGTTWANRANLCGIGCRVCSAADWVRYQLPDSGLLDSGASSDGASAIDAGGGDASPRDAAPPPAPARPPANFWVDDDLALSGAASYACAAIPADGGANTGGCAGQPMRICVSNPAANAPATDPTGDVCSLHDCGYVTQLPNLYFGGCMPTGDVFAGTLCCCAP